MDKIPGTADGTKWRNRIIGDGTADPEQLMANPANWRVHPKNQQEALSGVLGEIGWVTSVIVNRTTGHLVDGHLRVLLAMRHEEKEIPVKYVDLTPQEEKLILAVLDPIAMLAIADDDKLKELTEQIQTDNEAIRALLESTADIEVAPYDYTDLDTQLGEMEGFEEVQILVTIANKYKGQVMDYLANGEALTSPGMGKGILKRMGIL